MLKTFPATVIVVLLVRLVEFGKTTYCTVPFPAPLDPELMVTQKALLAAVQLHPAPAETLIEPEPPPTGKDLLVGEME